MSRQGTWKFPCSLRQSWLKRTWKLLNRFAGKFPLSTFDRKDILKILIFWPDCLIFCKAASFEAFQLQKKTMAFVNFAHNSHLGGLFTLFISFLVKIWKYLKVLAIISNLSALIHFHFWKFKSSTWFHKILPFLNLTQ